MKPGEQFELFENKDNTGQIKNPVTGKPVSKEEYLQAIREKNEGDPWLDNDFDHKEEEEEQEELFGERLTYNFISTLISAGGGSGVFTFYHALTTGKFTNKSIDEFVKTYDDNSYKKLKKDKGLPIRFPGVAKAYLRELVFDLELRQRFSNKLKDIIEP